METTQLLETPQAPKEKKGRKLPPFRMPRSKKGKKWLRRGIAAAVLLAGVWWIFFRSGPGSGAPAMGQFTSDTVQRRDLTVAV